MAVTRGQSIFINCPFDPAYQPLFDALLFAISRCGFIARSALEIVDSGEARLLKIIALMRESAFSIHDISRVTLDPKTELPRFNMPIELGIALGMKHLGSAGLRDHRLLVLDGAKAKQRFRYQRFASDLAGTDIRVHGNRPNRVIEHVRDFLEPHAAGTLPGARAIERRRRAFEQALPGLAKAADQEADEITFVARLRHIAAFLSRAE